MPLCTYAGHATLKKSFRNDLSGLKLRFQALDSTDFCNGKFGTWASRGYGLLPPLPPLYPPLPTTARIQGGPKKPKPLRLTADIFKTPA